MSRQARIVIPGCSHHVMQSARCRGRLFFDDADRRDYLGLLATYAARHGLAVEAYCLLDQAVLLVVCPLNQAALARTMEMTNGLYARAQHRRRGVGRLWAGRFYSCPLDDEAYWLAVRYVEQAPARAGLCTWPWEYRWSSAAVHIGPRYHADGPAEPPTACSPGMPAPLSPGMSAPSSPGMSAPPGLPAMEYWVGRDIPPPLWRAALEEPLAPSQQLRLLTATRRGAPLGDATFLRTCQALLGRPLQPRRRGRPRKLAPLPTPGDAATPTDATPRPVTASGSRRAPKPPGHRTPAPARRQGQGKPPSGRRQGQGRRAGDTAALAALVRALGLGAPPRDSPRLSVAQAQQRWRIPFLRDRRAGDSQT